MIKNKVGRIIILVLIGSSFSLYQIWKEYILSQDLSTGKYLEERFKKDSVFRLENGIYIFNRKEYISDVNAFYIKDKKTPCLSFILYPSSYDYEPVHAKYTISKDTTLNIHYSLKSTFLPFFDIDDPNSHKDSEGDTECYDVKNAYLLLKRHHLIGKKNKLFCGYKIDSLLKSTN